MLVRRHCHGQIAERELLLAEGTLEGKIDESHGFGQSESRE